MGWLRTSLTIAIAVVGVVAVAGGILYASDFGIEAKVTGKQCAVFGGPGSVTVRTVLLGIDYTLQGVPAAQCLAIQPDNFVRYHVRTGRTSLYESQGGDCIYDSVGGIGGCP